MDKISYKRKEFRSSYLALTYKCNNQCAWCYAEYYRKSHMPDMKYKLARNSLTLIRDLGIHECVLIGGEPTTYPYLFDIIKEGKKNNIKMALATNGTKLADISYINKLVDSGIASIVISIQGGSKEFHRDITKNTYSLKKTLKGIENCVKSSLKFGVNTVVGRDNIPEYKKLMDILHKIGVNKMSFNSCAPVLRNNKYEKILFPARAANIIESLYIYGKKIGMQVSSIFRLPLCLLDPVVRNWMIQEKSLQNGCHVDKGTVFLINSDGTILPCSRFIGYSVMNIIKNKKTFETISAKEFIQEWDFGRPYEFRKKILHYPSKRCIGCKSWRNNCSGGCPLFWYKFNPEKEIVGINRDPVK